MKKLNLILAIALLIAPVSGFAATGTASFSGTVVSTCILTAGTAGVIAPNADYTSMSSTNTGGSVSTVTAISNWYNF